jgi:hypothetical protein
MPESAIIISYFDLYMVSYSPNITVVNTDEYHVCRFSHVENQQ